MHISFVILHYVTIEDTCQCIASVLDNVNYDNFSIVVVDNGSINNSGEDLRRKYKDHNKINVIVNEKNLGFAKGNNVGYKYAKYELNADFIVLLNNDIVIEQEDFCDTIINKYGKREFHVLGPDIISLVDEKHQNPVPRAFPTIKHLNNKINKLKILLFLNYLNLDTLIINFNEKLNNDNVKNEECQFINVDKEDVQLHGSCLILSPLFVSVYEGLYDKTFMYLEECILRYIADRDNLKMLYSPDIRLYHKEDSSTNAVLTKALDKRRFYYKHSLNSCKELKSLMLSNLKYTKQTYNKR